MRGGLVVRVMGTMLHRLDVRQAAEQKEADGQAQRERLLKGVHHVR